MSKIFLSSDHHFGHENIIRYCDRPFYDATIMGKVMVDRWNSVVKENDIVLYLGDFSLAGKNVVGPLLDKLNGHKVLIWGNHDRRECQDLPQWDSVRKSFSFEYAMDDGSSVNVNLCHFPHENIKPNELYLHGHKHNHKPINNRQYDVGVDAHEFFPVELDSVIEKMSKIYGEFWK